MEYTTHPTAVVDAGALIGSGTKIWHWSHISAGAKIGQNCSIGQNAYIAPTAVIGNNVKIQNNVSVYDGVALEDDVFCGPSMVFTNVINPRSHIVRKSEYKKTLVKKGATIGANTTVICGVEIGRHAFIGAGSVVTKNVKDHALVMGVPAKQKGWICRCGVTLPAAKNNKTTCSNCGKKYAATRSSCQPL